MIMSARSLLLRNPDPDEEDVKKAIEGNLCRCTGYKPIVAAILEAAARERKDER
jgi:carbon-monoxide dehydrogenase small subunit